MELCAKWLARAAATAVALAMACPGCARPGATAGQGKMKPPPVPVTVAKAKRVDVPLQLRNIGTVEAYTTVTIRPQTGGMLTEVNVKDGAAVKKDELLFKIDPRPADAALKQAKANLARDTADAKFAAREAARLADLLKLNAATPDETEAARSKADSTAATVQADEAAIETAKLNLDYCTITAPMDSVAGGVMTNLGTIVKVNDTLMVTLNQVQPIYVTFSVPEENLPAIRKYMAAGELAMEATPPGEAGDPASGKLTFVNNSVDTTTGTITLKGTFANAGRRLWPGEFVQVVLTLTVQRGAVLVPFRAVQTGQSGQFVFVVNPDGTAHIRLVTVERTIDSQSLIAKGLDGGETVVTDGQLRLVDGSQVELQPDVTSRPAASRPAGGTIEPASRPGAGPASRPAGREAAAQ
jgi:multidrug efflux system membrane fusion protein